VCDINVYETSNWERIRTWSWRKDVFSVMFSPSSGQLFSGSGDDGTVRLWDVETGDCIHILGVGDKAVSSVGYNAASSDVFVFSVAYSPQGDMIASAKDKTVRVWNVETGECRHTLTGHSDEVRSVVYSPNGNQIASGSGDTTVRL
ncbi:hypothetical protein BGZ65_009815, partial [Modicella reniformis]